jgi:hypothetical protein
VLPSGHVSLLYSKQWQYVLCISCGFSREKYDVPKGRSLVRRYLGRPSVVLYAIRNSVYDYAIKLLFNSRYPQTFFFFSKSSQNHDEDDSWNFALSKTPNMKSQLYLLTSFGIFKSVRRRRHGCFLSFHNIEVDIPWSLTLVQTPDCEAADNIFPCCSEFSKREWTLPYLLLLLLKCQG